MTICLKSIIFRLPALQLFARLKGRHTARNAATDANMSEEQNPTIAFRAGDMKPHLDRLVEQGRHGNRSDIIQAGIWHMAQGFAGECPLESIQRIQQISTALRITARDLIDMLIDIHADEIRRKAVEARKLRQRKGKD